MILNKKKVLFIITGVIALVVLAGILALLLNLKTFRPQIEAAASTALGMDVRIKGRMGIALFPGFGLSLRDVNVRNNGLDVATIEKMRIGLKLLPLVRLEIKIIQIELVKPVFSIVRSGKPCL
jgi:uncharacterized protein involved in outer membrane biogenesis